MRRITKKGLVKKSEEELRNLHHELTEEYGYFLKLSQSNKRDKTTTKINSRLNTLNNQLYLISNEINNRAVK